MLNPYWYLTPALDCTQVLQGLLQQQLLASLAISPGHAAALLCQLKDPCRSRYRSRAEAVLLRCGFHLGIHPAHSIFPLHCQEPSRNKWVQRSDSAPAVPLHFIQSQLNPARINQIPIFTCTVKQALSVSSRL